MHDHGGRPLRFRDRADAGRQLARLLEQYRSSDAVVCGLPRGGVPVAYEVALTLGLPLDVVVVRKVGAPWQPELAIGAVGERGVSVLNASLARLAGVSEAQFERRASGERREVERRALLFRRGGDPMPLAGRAAIVVDDGVATGATCRAACQVARAGGARRVVLAVPVGAAESIEELSDAADEIVCTVTPRWFSAVGEWYDDFSQTSDAEVSALLARAAERQLPGELKEP